MSEIYNIVILTGTLTKTSLETELYDSPMFKATMLIGSGEHNQKVPINAWGNLAELLDDIPKGSKVKVVGSLTITSFSGNCNKCGGYQQVNWACVGVSSFKIIDHNGDLNE